MFLLSQVSGLVEIINTWIFSDTITARSFKLCMILTMLRVYIAILGLLTLTLFQGHRCIRNMNCKLHVFDSCPLHFKCCRVATYIRKIMHNLTCVMLVYIQGR